MIELEANLMHEIQPLTVPDGKAPMAPSNILQGTITLIAACARHQRAGGRLDAEITPGAVFRRGFLTNVLNPKVALFFLAFVPQFIAPGTAHPAWVFLALGLLFTVNGLLVCAGWALAAAWVARRAGVLQRTLRWLDGVAGGLFVAFGVRLALARAPGAA